MPTAKLSIQIESRTAVPFLEVTQPLCDNIDIPSQRARNCANKKDNDPSLRSIKGPI
jgi:hypothetical protein